MSGDPITIVRKFMVEYRHAHLRAANITSDIYKLIKVYRHLLLFHIYDNLPGEKYDTFAAAREFAQSRDVIIYFADICMFCVCDRNQYSTLTVYHKTNIVYENVEIICIHICPRSVQYLRESLVNPHKDINPNKNILKLDMGYCDCFIYDIIDDPPSEEWRKHYPIACSDEIAAEDYVTKWLHKRDIHV